MNHLISEFKPVLAEIIQQGIDAGEIHFDNPAALAEIDELLDRNLADNAAKMGAYFMEKLKTLPHVKEVRGQGLLIGVEFDDTVSSVDVKHECLHRHLLLTAIGDHIIRMVPPLIIDEKDCDEAYEIIKASVEALS